MKIYTVKKEHVNEATSWLKENVSAENVRWWFAGQQLRTWENNGVWVDNPQIWIDVTEEELPQLTWFVMKWSQ